MIGSLELLHFREMPRDGEELPLKSCSVSRRDYSWAAILAAVVVGVYLVWNGEFTMPLLHGDEGGYLGNARRFVDSVGVSAHGYLAGYSLLLVPSAMVTDDPWLFYRLSLDTNALIAGATAAMLFALHRVLFPASDRWYALAAAVFGIMVAGVAVFPLYAMSENVLVPGIVGATLILVIAARCESPSRRRGLLVSFAFICGFTAWANPRGLAVVFAGLVVAAALAIMLERWTMVDFAVVLGVTAATFVIGEIVNDIVVGKVYGAPGSDPTAYIDTITDTSLWTSIGLNMVRRIGYLTIASVGLMWAAGVWALKSPGKFWANPHDRSVIIALSFTAFALLPSLLLNSLTMGLTSESRMDQLFYGRYLEIYLPVLVVIGIGLVVTRLSRSEMRLVALLSFTASIVAAAALSIDLIDRIFAPINAVAIYALSVYVGKSLIGAFVLGGIVCGAVWLVMASRIRAGLVLGGLTLILILLPAHMVALAPYRQWRDAQMAIPVALVEMQREDRLECVAIMPTGDNWHQAHHYEYLVPGTLIEPWEDSACDLVVGTGSQRPKGGSIEVLAHEPTLDIYLWRLMSNTG